MKSLILTCLICIETVIAIAFATAAALAYGSILPTTTTPSAEYSSLPTPQTSAPRIISLPDGHHPLSADASRNTSTNSTVREGLATYFTIRSCQREGTSGVLTASGRKYDENSTTIALPFHPEKWGKSYRITNLSNGKSITAKHWDYGPGKRARSRGVITDLSPKVFESIGGKLRDGRMRVKIEAI